MRAVAEDIREGELGAGVVTLEGALQKKKKEKKRGLISILLVERVNHGGRAEKKTYSLELLVLDKDTGVNDVHGLALAGDAVVGVRVHGLPAAESRLG